MLRGYLRIFTTRSQMVPLPQKSAMCLGPSRLVGGSLWAPQRMLCWEHPEGGLLQLPEARRKLF